MDHIPLPKAPFSDHVEVPYYTCDANTYNYSPPWVWYAARNGYTDTRLTLIAADGLPAIAKPAFASFVQSWLFFGALQEFLINDYPLKDLTRKNAAGTCIISTQQLCNRLQLWRDGVLAMSVEERRAECLRIDRLLDRMSTTHDTLSFKIMNDETAGFHAYLALIPQELSLSILVLHTTLACEKRIRAFILLRKHFPQISIFEQTEMQSFREERGFRWAPPSFVFRQKLTTQAETLPS